MEVSFDGLEKEVFRFCCEMGQKIIEEILLEQDHKIMNERDRSRFRLKDTKKTTIKTILGEVTYNRRYYFDKDKNEYCFLLDDMMNINKRGLFSETIAERIVRQCIAQPYRKAADTISELTGQDISHVGAWKLVQQVGCNIAAKEEENLSDMKRGIKLGAKKIDVLFQEADGVWLKMQKNKKKAPKAELKLGTVYEGWKDTERHELVNKKVFAGFESGSKFMLKFEAYIKSIYRIDDINIKLLNGDGASWIDFESMDMTYRQLDQYHLNMEITKNIKNKNIRKLVKKNIRNKKIDKALEYVEAYINSEDKYNEDLENFYKYLVNNKEGLISYNKKIILPEPPKGMVYRRMGVQENQNCTLVTMRMKHRRMRWSESGAANLAKVICSSNNNDLKKYINNEFGFQISLPDNEEEINALELKTRDYIYMKDGKGNRYAEAINQTLPIINSSNIIGQILRNIINR